MTSDYLGVVSKLEKGQETAAVEKSYFATSQSGGMKTEIKFSKFLN